MSHQGLERILILVGDPLCGSKPEHFLDSLWVHGFFGIKVQEILPSDLGFSWIGAYGDELLDGAGVVGGIAFIAGVFCHFKQGFALERLEPFAVADRCVFGILEAITEIIKLAKLEA